MGPHALFCSKDKQNFALPSLKVCSAIQKISSLPLPFKKGEGLGVGFGQSWLHSAVHASMTALICSFEQDFTHQAEQGGMATCA